MKIPLERGTGRGARIPLARQIQLHLERLIGQGLLRPGVKLPATREPAQDLRVNRTTVAAAYEELVAAGWARAHVGQGTFVADQLPERVELPAAATPPVNWGALLSKRAQVIGAEARRREAYSQMTRPAPGVISFAGGMPDSALFPTDGFRRVLNAVIREEGRELLQYYPAAGYAPLREYLAGYLLRFGVEARPEEILIVNGSQQGFDLVARTLLDPGDFVAIEQPSYPRAIQVFRSFGAELLPVPMGEGGVALPHLERLLERQAPKFLYCQPSAHNPTGLTMPSAARQRLLELAARHRLPIVEDGFDGALYYGERPPSPLKASDAAGQIVYIGTFSKILFPGLRLGWIVAAPELIERLGMAKQLADIHTSPLIQAAVYHFCQRRLLERHQARVVKEYERRRNALVAALGHLMPAGVTWTEPQGGFSLLVTLPEGADARTLLPRALSRNVAFTPGDAFFVDGGGERTLRLSFSSVPLGQIEDGVRRLAEAVEEDCAVAPGLPRETARTGGAPGMSDAVPGREAGPVKFETLAARGGRDVASASRPLVAPIYQTNVYVFEDMETVESVWEHKAPGFVYGRYGTGNHAMLESLVAALEGAEAGVAAASGMGATTALLLGLFEAGDHLVSARDLYGSTAAFLGREGLRLGVETTFVDATDPAAVLAALRPTTRAVFVEAVSNPLLRLVDLPAIAPDLARRGVELIVDASMASPAVLRPIDHGAALVLHSLTKFISGHGDVTHGIVLGRREPIGRIRDAMIRAGTNLGPFDAWLAVRGARTLGVRMERQSASALALARHLEAHRAVARVYYPGLASHPQHALARRLMAGPMGAMLSFDLGGGALAVERFMSRTRLMEFAPSFGDVATTWTYPARTSHRRVSDEDKAAMGIGAGLVRVSVGLEDAGDLKGDLDDALD